ncbi:MAG TPA: 50S ribosomal protein L2, partial [Pelagibacteraceae bacterium]|nr:50S ribosomal protein L2 [Pelagibacteraceae bacterium]
MTLKTFKPYTKSTRGTVIIAKKNLWKGKPIKSLTFGKKSVSGRNNLGRITSRRRGSGHKQKFRKIDFFRNK